jgi:hypothetical protein
MMTMMRELPGLTGRWKPRSEAMVNTSAMPPRRRAGLLPTHAMSAARLPLLLPIARTILALFLHSISSPLTHNTATLPSQKRFLQHLRGTNKSRKFVACVDLLSLSLSLPDLSQHYKTSLLKLAPLRIRPRKATRGRYGSHKKKMRPRTFAYRPVRLDSTRRRSHKRTLREDIKSAKGPFCTVCFFFP